MKNKQFIVPPVTPENCKWVTDKLLERNPTFLSQDGRSESERLAPEHLFEIMLTVWVRAHGRPVPTLPFP